MGARPIFYYYILWSWVKVNIGIGIYQLFSKYIESNLENEIYYLHATDEREASEEPHGSSDSRQLAHKLGCSVLQNNFVTFTFYFVYLRGKLGNC